TFRIRRTHAPSVHHDRALRNRQPQPSTLAAKWREDAPEHLLRHPRPLIPHHHHHVPTFAPYRNLDLTLLSRVPHGISHDILQRAPQRTLVADNCAATIVLHYHPPSPRRRFGVRIAHHLVPQPFEINLHPMTVVHTPLNPRQRQQLLDQRVQPPCFLADPFQIFRRHRGIPLRQTQHHQQPRERR